MELGAFSRMNKNAIFLLFLDLDGRWRGRRLVSCNLREAERPLDVE
jgi:hypothetical protein